MDPLTATIWRQSGAIVLGFLAVGLAAALIYGFWRYGQLQHALTLPMIPRGLP